MRRFLLILVLLGSSGGLAWRSYHQQSRLHQQLAQLTAVLTVENDRVAQETENTIKGIAAVAAKNRNQPVDLALLRRAENLQARANELLATLRSSDGQPRRATSRRDALPPQQLLAQQLTAYTDSLRQLSPALAAPLLVPAFDETTPVAEVSASLGQLENQILARQAAALQRIAKAVGARRWLTHLLVTTTAESDVVPPGDTYRAQLGIVGYYSANQLKMAMTCNGRPVPTSPAGTGLVRFRAPARLGPTSWTGTIRINQNGRDTTFKVTVPYRVVRH